MIDHQHPATGPPFMRHKRDAVLCGACSRSPPSHGSVAAPSRYPAARAAHPVMEILGQLALNPIVEIMPTLAVPLSWKFRVYSPLPLSKQLAPVCAEPCRGNWHGLRGHPIVEIG